MKHDIFKKAKNLFAVLNFILIFSTAYVAWEEISFYGSGHEVIGKVVGFDTEYKGDRKLLFPIIRFLDDHGDVHVGKSNMATIYSGIHKIGRSYSMIYNQKVPEKLRPNSFFGLFGKLVLVAFMTYLNFILLLIFNYYWVITPAKNDRIVLLR